MLISKVWLGSSGLLFRGTGMWIARWAADQVFKRGGTGFSTSDNGNPACCWPTLQKWKARKSLWKHQRNNKAVRIWGAKILERKEVQRDEAIIQHHFPLKAFTKFQAAPRETESWEELLAVSGWRGIINYSGPTKERSQGKHPRLTVEMPEEVHPSSSTEPEIDQFSQRPSPASNLFNPWQGQIHCHLLPAHKKQKLIFSGR